MKVYLDSAPIIYLIEEAEPFATAVDQYLKTPGLILVSSDLTRMECLIKPLRINNTDLIQDFNSYFAGTVSEMLSLSRTVMDRAAEIRAQYGFKTPDAIHMAAAVTAGCDVFYTNDHRLDRFPHLSVEIIDPNLPQESKPKAG